jgi:hypothetical protein
VRKFAKGRSIYVIFHAGMAGGRLKQLNTAKRAARPPSDATDSKVIEYLYDYRGYEYRVTKKTAKRVFFMKNRNAGCSDIGFTHSGEDNDPGFIDRRLVFDEWPATQNDLYDFSIKIDGRSKYYWRCLWTSPPPAWRDEVKLPDLKALKAAMAAAHPDKGGSNEAFIAARQAYENARRIANSRGD